jgi:mRNA-degrading endonuclease RelE of RelBE toxin-antitoxin system
MAKYKLIFDKKFLKKYRNKIDKSSQKTIDKKILELQKNPKKGKPLFSIHPHLYELYAKSYRIYYIIHHKEIRIVVLAYEHKNNQKKFLNTLNTDKTIIDDILKEIL